MRIICLGVILPCVVGCNVQRPAPRAQVDLPYSACEPMADFRSNLTGTPYPSAKSDATLHRRGVRCVGAAYQPAVAPRY